MFVKQPTAPQKSYAVKPETFAVTTREYFMRPGDPSRPERRISQTYSVEAIWFNGRRNGRVGAYYGTLYGSRSFNPDVTLVTEWSLEEFFENGDPSQFALVAWDGKQLWFEPKSQVEPEKQFEMLNTLKPFYANRPQLQDGWDGWYKKIS